MNLSLTEQHDFFYYLYSFVSSGISLPKSLSLLSVMTNKRPIKKIIKKLIKYLEEGRSFSDSLQMAVKFDLLIINLVKIAEASAGLEESLGKIHAYLKDKIELRRKIFDLCFYPAMVFFFSIIAFIFLSFYLFPFLIQIAAESNTSLPRTIQILAGAIGFFKINFFYLAGFIVFAAIFLFSSLKNSNLLNRLTESFYNAPFLGRLFKNYFLAYFSDNMSFLLKNGVDLIESLKIVSQDFKNRLFKKEINLFIHSLKQGRDIKTSLQGSRFFDLRLIEMLALGEQTGSLAILLNKGGKFYEEEFQRMLKNLFRGLEIGLILFSGIVVGLFILLTFSPVLKIMRNL